MGQVKVHIVPGKGFKTKEDFIANTPPYSIGLDGVVSAPTFRVVTPRGPWANYDHHVGVDRLSTRATSAQIHLEINMGLFSTFKMDGEPHANLWINDVDQDVCLAVWMLQNHERVRNHAEPLINKLVYTDEILDTTGGAYPFPADSSVRRELDWIFEPYLTKRYSGTLRKSSASDLRTVLEAVCYRIGLYTVGQGQKIDMGGESKVLHVRKNYGVEWALVTENGPKARALSYAGHDAFIAWLGERNGRYDYTIARRSVWIPFPVDELYEYLNSIDDQISGENRWNGSNIIGGSPRDIGSKWNPEQLVAHIDTFLKTREGVTV
jgi:hypothetical protein